MRKTYLSQHMQQGFSLIELMVVVAIVGILISTALPNYREYIFQSERREAQMAMLAIVQVQAEYRYDTGAYAASLDDLGKSATVGDYTLSLDVSNDGFVLSAKNAAPTCAEFTLNDAWVRQPEECW